jgi:hypothetical protein
MKAVEGFLFGADPELFLVDADGTPVSAAGLIPGTKKEPFKVDKGAVQVDGMAAEFNIDPVDNFEDFNGNITTVMKQLKAMLPKGIDFLIQPSVRFSQSIMDAQDASAKAMGCDPDFNAWTGEVNPYPDTSPDPLLRTASGHVHVGWTDEAVVTDEDHVGLCRDLVKQLDWFLGAWSTRVDTDFTRRQLYGKAGAFRPKPYGVEYRVLSNFWLTSRDRRRLVWNRMQLAIQEMRRYNMPELVKPFENDNVISLINEGNGSGIEKLHSFPIKYVNKAYANVRLPREVN